MKAFTHNALALLLVLTGATDACGSPLMRLWRLAKRATTKLNDFDNLNYALTLEHLEATFYRQGLANFTEADFAAAGYNSTFYTNIQKIAADESAHVDFLTKGIAAAGGTPVQECTYAFGVTSVAAFIATASVLEGVGVSAYLGAAASITNKAYLTAAGSILTIEARHSAYIRSGLSLSPFPQSQDDPLTPNEVYSLAHGFITACPSGNPALPVKAFPGISVTSTGVVATGTAVGVRTSGYVLAAHDTQAHLFAAFVGPNGPVWATLTSAGDGMNFQITVPDGVYGQSYLVLTKCNDTVSDDSVVAGPAILEIAPTTSFAS